MSRQLCPKSNSCLPSLILVTFQEAQSQRWHQHPSRCQCQESSSRDHLSHGPSSSSFTPQHLSRCVPLHPYSTAQLSNSSHYCGVSQLVFLYLLNPSVPFHTCTRVISKMHVPDLVLHTSAPSKLLGYRRVSRVKKALSGQDRSPLQLPLQPCFPLSGLASTPLSALQIFPMASDMFFLPRVALFLLSSFVRSWLPSNLTFSTFTREFPPPVLPSLRNQAASWITASMGAQCFLQGPSQACQHLLMWVH